MVVPMFAWAESDDIMTPYGKYPETVVITTAKITPAKAGFLEGDSAVDNPMTRYIEEKVNVKFELLWEVENAEFANKLALNLATGDLPDMFTLGTNDYVLFKQLIDNDMLEPMDEAYEACANDYIKTAFDTFDNENLKPFYGDDGKLYAVAGTRYPYEHNLLWLRQDWMDASGLAAPTTLDDLHSILVEWKNNPPAEDYVGMILHATQVGNVYESMSASPIFAAFGAYPNMWLYDEEGKAVWGSVCPEVKEGLAVLHDWYAEGLIDQQFITRTQSGAREAVWNGGMSGAMFAPWWLPYGITDFYTTQPDGVLKPYNAPVDADGNYNIAFPGLSGSFVCVRKGFEHPEAVIKAMNIEFDMWRGFDPDGVEAIAATRSNGVEWTYMFPTGGFNVERIDCVPESGIAVKDFIEHDGQFSGDGTFVTSHYEIMANEAYNYYKNGHDAATADWIEYVARYVGASPEIMYADNVVPVKPSYSFVTESMADLKPNLDTLEQTTFLKIIVGELPVDAFDQFVTDWYAQGGQQITDEANEWYLSK
jgi:putative aldouronate transport system substrate-binding protein